MSPSDTVVLVYISSLLLLYDLLCSTADVSLEVAQAMLWWVYTDQSDIIQSADDTFVLELLAIAKNYRLDPLSDRHDEF